MIVYAVRAFECEESSVDSIWDTEALANERKLFLESTYPRFPRPKIEVESYEMNKATDKGLIMYDICFFKKTNKLSVDRTYLVLNGNEPDCRLNNFEDDEHRKEGVILAENDEAAKIKAKELFGIDKGE